MSDANMTNSQTDPSTDSPTYISDNQPIQSENIHVNEDGRDDNSLLSFDEEEQLENAPHDIPSARNEPYLGSIQNENDHLIEQQPLIMSDMLKRMSEMEAHHRAMEDRNLAMEARNLAMEARNLAMEETILLLQEVRNDAVRDQNTSLRDESYHTSKDMHITGAINDKSSANNSENYLEDQSHELHILLASGDTFDEDIFTLMMISECKVVSRPWALGTVCYIFQMALAAMIFNGQIKLVSKEVSALRFEFDIPFKVDPDVRIGQLLCMMFCLTYQSDILSSIRSFVLGRRLLKHVSSNNRTFPGLASNALTYRRNIIIPNIFKFTEGFFVLIVSIIIIYTSSVIIDLLKDFTALMVISEADDIIFRLAAYGFLGQDLQEMTKIAKNIELPKLQNDDINSNPEIVDAGNIFTRFRNHLQPSTQSNKSKEHLARSAAFVLCFAAIFSGWLVVVIRQNQGFYFERRFPDCKDHMHLKDKFGDGKCYGGPLNSLGCEFEGGDCISFNQAYPLCKGDHLTEVEDLVGDGNCDIEFMTNNCNYDGGDCCPLDIIQSAKFGDGQCNGGLISTIQCGYDNGDCHAFVEAHGNCPLLLKEAWSDDDKELNTTLGDEVNTRLGDGVCDGSRYSSLEECGYEFGDCGAGQIGNDLIFGEASADSYLDFEVATSSEGTIAAIGLPSAFPEGFIQVYEFTELERWTKHGRSITLSEENGSSRYKGSKYSITMNGNGTRVAVGIPWSDRSRGQVKVFDFHPLKGEWSQVGDNIVGEAQGDKAGSRIAMNSDGSRLAIAAPEASNKFDKGGRINIYSYNGTSWTELGQGIFGGNNYHFIGDQIGLNGLDLNAADGSRVIFSCGYSSFMSIALYVYDEINEEWMQLGYKLFSENSSSLTISSDGNRIAIGINSDSSQAPGEVHAFEFVSVQLSNGLNLKGWIMIGEIYSSTTSAGDGFGQSITMSDDGNLLAIGSARYGCDDYGGTCLTGAVELFRFIQHNGFVHLPLKNPEKRQKIVTSLRTGGDSTKSIIQDGERGQKKRVFGSQISFTSNSEYLSVSAYDLTNEVGIVKAYRLDKLFHEKCAVPRPSLIGDGTCNPKGPYNTPECGFDGGDCVNSAFPSLSPTLTPVPSFSPTMVPSSYPSLSQSPSRSPTSIPSSQPSISASPTRNGQFILPQPEPLPNKLIVCPPYLKFYLMTDYYPGEISWTLHDENGVLVESGPPVGDEYEPSKLYSFYWDLDPNMSYRLVVRDSFGDGLSSGYIKIVLGLYLWCRTEDIDPDPNFGSKYSLDIN